MNNAENHVDIRTVVSYLDKNGSESIYLGTDGGISVTTDGNTWEDITGEGLAITNYFGVAVTDRKKDYILAGAQDGSINFYNRGKWLETRPWGDNGDCLIDPDDTDIVYLTSQGSLFRRTDGISLTGNGTWISPTGLAFMFPLLMNPNNSHELFVPARQSGINRLAFSNNQGNNWTYLPTQNDARVTGVGISESNDNVIYAGLTGGTGVQRFTRNNGNSPWIPGPAVNIGFGGPITDIAVDPNDFENVWVTVGWFSNGNKVFNSKDGGQSWANVSSCLPNITMTAISFQKGSDDGIYVGSDFGVFYKNAEMEDWILYGNGGPRTMVADMEMNNCTNELIVATQGRGMWKVPMLRVGEKEITNLDEDVIWDTETTLIQDVRITEGTTLRIENTTVNVAEGRSITVEKGAQLIVDGSRLTSLCDGMWQGIKVLGDSGESQAFCPNSFSSFPCHQGYVRIKNHSTIENAVIGVHVREIRGGGILVASNSAFLNNETAVWFAPFQNTNPITGQLTGNLSRFNDCHFMINEDYIGHYAAMRQQVKLNVVTGIEFYACNFNNSHPDRAFINDGKIGIDSRDSEFIVTSTCNATQLPCPPDNVVPSEFRGFEKGIYAHNEFSANTFRVTHTNFYENHVGLIVDGVSHPYIVKNNFYVGSDLPIQVNFYRGLQLDECTAYQVEQNHFMQNDAIGTNNQFFLIGSIILKSGAEPNVVYKNRYENIGFANVAQGTNQGAENVGLEYHCNRNLGGNFFDFVVSNESSIAASQGNAQQSAGNVFTPNPLSNVPTHFYSEGNDIDYFCVPNSGCPNPIHTSSNIFQEDAIGENSCPSRLPDDDKGKLSDTEKSQFESEVSGELTPTINSPTKNRKVNALVRDRLIDTTNYDLIYMRSHLEEKGNLKSKFTVVDSWLQEGNPQQAMLALTAIGEDYDFPSSSEEKEYKFFEALKKIQISAVQESISYEKMINDNKVAIKFIADAGDYIGSNQAKRMINTMRPTYERIIELPYMQSDQMIQPLTGNIDAGAFLYPTVEAIPNPAKEKTTFHYRLPEKVIEGEIIVTNLLGQVIDKISVSEEFGQIDWDISKLERDIYIYTLYAEGKIIKTNRLVITK